MDRNNKKNNPAENINLLPLERSKNALLKLFGHVLSSTNVSLFRTIAYLGLLSYSWLTQCSLYLIIVYILIIIYLCPLLYSGMTQRTCCLGRDLALVRAVFADATHPELVIEQRPAGHDTRRELRVARRAHGGAVKQRWGRM